MMSRAATAVTALLLGVGLAQCTGRRGSARDARTLARASPYHNTD